MISIPVEEGITIIGIRRIKMLSSIIIIIKILNSMEALIIILLNALTALWKIQAYLELWVRT